MLGNTPTVFRLQQGFAIGEMGFAASNCVAKILDRACRIGVLARARLMTASLPTAAREQTFPDRRFGPKADIGNQNFEMAQKQH